tara:strand:+ start:2131 stop:3258 length:1128 start_codon:yes stop_codon:yes gene_type:complete
MKQIYFDHSATTPISEDILEHMYQVLKNNFGNPSSIHQFGQSSRALIENARRQIAITIGASPKEIYFTGGGSESNNIVIKNILNPGDHLITSSIEHPAILKPAEELQKNGVEVSFVKPNSDGIIQTKDVIKSIKDNTKLISIMMVNNELGTINPIKEYSQSINNKGILLHTDAVQAFGKIPLNVSELNVDVLSLSGHKFYGPKGVGILYKKNNIPLTGLITGGGQEQDLRAGTENVAGISAIGIAAEKSFNNLENNSKKITEITDYFLSKLINENITHKINGSNRVPGVLNISFPKISGQILMINLDLLGIAVSYGAACSSGTPKPPKVLLETGLPSELAKSSIRISFGKDNTIEEIDYFIDSLKSILSKELKGV